MKILMRYKNYYGSVESSAEYMALFGKIQFITALISYEGETTEEIKHAFHEAVDNYLNACHDKRVKPEKALNILQFSH